MAGRSMPGRVLSDSFAIVKGTGLILGAPDGGEVLNKGMSFEIRWATIGAAGLLLLWLGATAERRLGQLREFRQRLQGLEHHGTAEAPH